MQGTKGAPRAGRSCSEQSPAARRQQLAHMATCPPCQPSACLPLFRSAARAPPTCRFSEDQKFTQAQETQIKAVALIEGSWYVRVTGDYDGRVSGAVYEVHGSDSERKLQVQVRGRGRTRRTGGRPGG